MLRSFVDALNHLGGQPCGMFLLVCGIALSVLYGHWHMPLNLPEQLVLAGALLIRQDATPAVTINAPKAETQTISTSNPTQPPPR